MKLNAILRVNKLLGFIFLTTVSSSCIKDNSFSNNIQLPASTVNRDYLVAFVESFNYDTTSEISLINTSSGKYTKLTSYYSIPFYRQYVYSNCYDIRFDQQDSNRITHSISYGNNPLGTSLQTVDIHTKISTGHASILNAINENIYSGGFWFLNSNQYPSEYFLYNTSYSIMSYDRSSLQVKSYVSINSPSNMRLRDLFLAPNKSTIYYTLVRLAKYGKSTLDTFYLYKTNVSFSSIQPISQWTANTYYSDNINVLADVSKEGDLLLFRNGWKITDSNGITKKVINDNNLNSSPRFIPNNPDSILTLGDYLLNWSTLYFVNINNNGKRLIYNNGGLGFIRNAAIR